MPETLSKVTPLSKYFALLLFIVMPFVGGYIGYQFAFQNTVVDNAIYIPSAPPVATTTADAKVNSDVSATASSSRDISEKEFFASKEQMFTLLYTTPDNEAYYEAGKPGSSACCRIYKYDYRTEGYSFVTEFDIILDKYSPSKKLFARPVDGEGVTQKIEVLSTNSGAPVASIENLVPSEIFASGGCGYSGYTYDIKWIDDKTVRYGVFKADSADQCDYELIEYRDLKI